MFSATGLRTCVQSHVCHPFGCVLYEYTVSMRSSLPTRRRVSARRVPSGFTQTTRILGRTPGVRRTDSVSVEPM